MRCSVFIATSLDGFAADAFVDPLVTRDVIRSGWLGAPAATRGRLRTWMGAVKWIFSPQRSG